MERIYKPEMHEAIIRELGNFNFKRTSMSYQYLIDAILLVIDNKTVIKDFKLYVYPNIAEKYDTKPENVLWSITKLLKVMYLNTDANIIKNYFDIAIDENPSTKAFIIHVAYKISKKIIPENTEISSNLQFLL